MARSAGFGGDFFFHLNRLRLRVTLQLGQVRTIVSLRRYVRHLPHDPFKLGRLLRLLLIVERDFFAKFPRICHLCDVFSFSLDFVFFFSMHACKIIRIRFSFLVAFLPFSPVAFHTCAASARRLINLFALVISA